MSDDRWEKAEIVLPKKPWWNDREKVFHCSLCLGSGVVKAIHLAQGGAAYAFRCSCAMGMNDGRAYPRWHSNLTKEFKALGERDLL
jgi:hypothetical protein